MVVGCIIVLETKVRRQSRKSINVFCQVRMKETKLCEEKCVGISEYNLGAIDQLNIGCDKVPTYPQRSQHIFLHILT